MASETLKESEVNGRVNVVLYVRVSSERQAEKGLSISSQLRELHRYCEKRSYLVLNEFIDEGISGTTDQRPGFQAMISYCKLNHERLDAVLVWKFNRFSRDRVDSAVYKRFLRKLNINVISITEPIAESIDSELLEAMVEAMDSRFSKSLAQDVMRGIRETAKRGFYPLSTAPLGYKRVVIRDGKAKRYILILDEEMAPLIRRIFTMYVDKGEGAKAIATTLNEEGLTTGRGKPWNTKRILNIISNPIYPGTLHIEFTTDNARYLPQQDRTITVEDAFAPLIDKETFAQAQRLREKRARAPSRQLGSDYLLSGLLTCEQCGSTLYGVPAKSSSHFYYACKRYYESGKKSCNFGMVNRDRLDSIVLEKVTEVLLSDCNLQILAEEVNSELGGNEDRIRKEQTLLKSQLRKKRKKLDRLVDAVESGQVTGSALHPRINARQQEVEKLISKLTQLNQQDHAAQTCEVDLEQLRPYVVSLKDTLATASTKTQRSILQSFIREIEVGKEQITIEFTIPQEKQEREHDLAPVLGMVASGTPEGT